MRCARVVGSLLALSTLLAPGVAHAQIFSVYIQPKAQDAPTPNAKAEKFRRLHIGGFLALWDSPPIGATRFQLEGGPAGTLTTVRAEPDLDASPLVTADYYLSPHFSIGGWWNPVQGDIDVRRGAAGRARLDFRDNFYDGHIAFHAGDRRWGFLPRIITKGLTIQAGYSVQNIDVDALPGTAFPGGGADAAFTLTSPNLWITKAFDLGSPFRGREDRPVSLFVSAGQYFSEDFDNAWNLMGGVTFTISPRLSLSGSYWRVFSEDTGQQQRISVGLTGRY